MKGANADYYYPTMQYSKKINNFGDGDFSYKWVDSPSKCDGKTKDNGNGDGCYTLYWALNAGENSSHGDAQLVITGAYKLLATSVVTAAVAASLI